MTLVRSRLPHWTTAPVADLADDLDNRNFGVAGCLNWYRPPKPPQNNRQRTNYQNTQRELVRYGSTRDGVYRDIQRPRSVVGEMQRETVLEEVVDDVLARTRPQSRDGRYVYDNEVYNGGDLTGRRGVLNTSRRGQTTTRWRPPTPKALRTNPNPRYYRSGTPTRPRSSTKPSGKEITAKITIRQTENGKPVSTVNTDIQTSFPDSDRSDPYYDEGLTQRGGRYFNEFNVPDEARATIGYIRDDLLERRGLDDGRITTLPPNGQARNAFMRKVRFMDGPSQMNSSRDVYRERQNLRGVPRGDDWMDNHPVGYNNGRSPRIAHWNRTWDA